MWPRTPKTNQAADETPPVVIPARIRPGRTRGETSGELQKQRMGKGKVGPSRKKKIKAIHGGYGITSIRIKPEYGITNPNNAGGGKINMSPLEATAVGCSATLLPFTANLVSRRPLDSRPRLSPSRDPNQIATNLDNDNLAERRSHGGAVHRDSSHPFPILCGFDLEIFHLLGVSAELVGSSGVRMDFAYCLVFQDLPNEKKASS
ncbi:uncharacterized protein J3R85_015611 [Psidium guajava]|nr:uncharacterized protein J3R85_015611 [Psidium guajava]